MVELPPTSLPAHPSARKLGLGLGASWLAVSSSAVVIVLAAPAPPLTVAASRVAITALLWSAVTMFVRHGDAGRDRVAAAPPTARQARSLWIRILLSGILLGVHFSLWIGSLSLTSVPHAAVLVALQPLFAGLFGLLLGDRASWRLVVGVGVALFGTAMMTRGESAGATLLGDGLAILAAACAAAYLAINRGIRYSIPLSSLLARVNLVAAITVAVAIAASGTPWWHPEAGGAEIASIVWLGVAPGFLGHGLMNWAARTVPVHVVSVAVLLEPVGAAALAWLALRQGIGVTEAVGALLLLGGAGLTLVPASTAVKE